MRKIDVTRQFFEASGLQGHFFEKKKQKKNTIFRYGLGECGYRIHGCRFLKILGLQPALKIHFSFARSIIRRVGRFENNSKLFFLIEDLVFVNK